MLNIKALLMAISTVIGISLLVFSLWLLITWLTVTNPLLLLKIGLFTGIIIPAGLCTASLYSHFDEKLRSSSRKSE